MTSLMTDNLILVGICLFALLLVGFIFSRLYRRASKERSFVRTGLGGQKVVMDGGAIVFPVFHETSGQHEHAEARSARAPARTACSPRTACASTWSSRSSCASSRRRKASPTPRRRSASARSIRSSCRSWSKTSSSTRCAPPRSR